MSERRVYTRATTDDCAQIAFKSVSVRLPVRLAYRDKPGGLAMRCKTRRIPCSIPHVPYPRRDARCEMQDATDNEASDRGGDPRGPPSMTMMLVFTHSFTHGRMTARQTVHNATHLVSCSEGSAADGLKRGDLQLPGYVCTPHPASTQCSVLSARHPPESESDIDSEPCVVEPSEFRRFDVTPYADTRHKTQ